MDLERLRDLLRGWRFRTYSEAALQAGIAQALDTAGVVYEREVILSPRSRPDFLVGGIAIEVKVDGSALAAIRQALRYAQHERVTAVLIVTTRARHQAEMPDELLGKPVRVVHLVGGLL